jgi:energy-coupling factor transporter ATP-binding protein EcfA2
MRVNGTIQAARQALDELADEKPSIELPTERVVRSTPLNWEDLEGKHPLARTWCIKHWFPAGHVALLAGAPGSGKTLLAQTIASCLVTGRDYLDLVDSEHRVLMWACEDDVDEMWRRQLAICKSMNESLSAFSDRLIVHCYEGAQVELAARVNMRLQPTPMLTELRDQIGDYRANVVFLDNTARLFGGNENDRHEVTKFVTMLQNAARPTGAATGLLHHTGKAIGSEYSGSTAWEGAVRTRLYLGTKLPGEDDSNESMPVDDGVRFLSRRKANYSSQDWRRIRYLNGVMVPDAASEGGRRGEVSDQFVQDVVIRIVRKLTAMSEHPMAGTASPYYLPRLAKKYELLEGVPEKRIAVAMRQLQVANRLVKRPVGKYGNGNTRDGLAIAE